jgi:hypothetical protein
MDTSPTRTISRINRQRTRRREKINKNAEQILETDTLLKTTESNIHEDIMDKLNELANDLDNTEWMFTGHMINESIF